MKLKRTVGVVLMISLSMGILACAPENESNASNTGKSIPIEVYKVEDGQPVRILRDRETGVEYIYVYNYTTPDKPPTCAICPRLYRDGRPVATNPYP